MPKMYTMA